MKCQSCQKDTKNPKFCSRSCSASFTNKTQTKRKKTKTCLDCSSLILSNRLRCRQCFDKHRNLLGDLSLKEAIYQNHHKSSAYALVRTRARAIAKKHGLNKCLHCGYSKHVEIAHIKAIPTFPLSTMISVINDLSNLIPLCPNCHWEFDHPK